MQGPQRALPAAVAAPLEIVALPEVFSVVDKANLPALQASLQLPELWQEAAVLQRLTYKNKNQHRASKHLQAVQQVCKTLKLFKQLQLQQLLQELHSAAMRTSLPEAAPAAAAAAAAAGKKGRQSKPSSSSQGGGGSGGAAGTSGDPILDMLLGGL
ncbi:hypothetical protein OEZ85_000701 [Tetradesmus obliquus]|uniref:Nucleolus and neural progenitor protein-like N-terminal domain-containing protein n=1 Tax=Tetradesmus obliquus TaxID=3088 RepID=A0ABY8UMJ2_TETOB|nr:hypothetical protein OEZ85_000701 [Tetradesmus obliquus]